MPAPLRVLSILASLSLLCLFLSACNEPEQGPEKKGKKQAAHRVETLRVEPRLLAIQRERTGSLMVRRQVRIHTQEEGEIKSLPYFEGDRVAEGALIATLQDSLLQAELRKATAQQQQAQQDLQRLARLAERKLSSDDELGRARTALQVAEAEQNLLQTRLEHTRIRAPFAGLISERPMEPGDVAPKHAHLLTLIDPDSLIAEADASELLLPNLKKGDKVEIRIDALRRAPYPGHILRIHPHINPLTRLGRIEVAFEKAPPQAKAGQMAHLTFTIPARERLLVPFSALQRDRSGEFLYRLHTGKAQRQRVVSGIRIGELVEIEDGVQTGDRVVIRGFMGLRDGKAISDSRDREPDHAKP